MASIGCMDELEEIEILQRELFSMKKPDFKAYLEEKNKYLKLIEIQKNDLSNENLKRELEDLVEVSSKMKSIYEKKKMELKELENELDKAKESVRDFENEMNLEKIKYEEDINKVENALQLEVLRNIERRTVLQKTKLKKLEARHKRNKYNY